MANISRRNFVKMATAAVAGASLTGLSGFVTGCGAKATENKQSVASSGNAGAQSSGKSKVYFTKHIDGEHLKKLYEKVNSEISGRVAIKLHTGEPHGPNILPRDMVRDFQAGIPDSSIIEANVAYGGPRSTTAQHRETLAVNGWNFCPVDIIDEDGDVSFPVNGVHHLKEVAVGSHLTNYDSMVVLTHFKGYVSIHQQCAA